MTTAAEMANNPDNPYKIQQGGHVDHGVIFTVLNPDGTEYGDYATRESAEWWAAHLYWRILNPEEAAKL